MYHQGFFISNFDKRNTVRNKKPTSFIAFIIAAIITALVFITAYFFIIYDVDLEYTMILAILLFVAFILSAFGIYTGFKNKTHQKEKQKLNQLGLVGNILIYFSMIIVIAMAALSQVSE